MVEGKQQNMFRFPQSQQRGAEKQITLQVKRSLRFLLSSALGFQIALFFHKRSQINYGQANGCGSMDYLSWHPLLYQEGGPEGLMPAHDFRQALFQSSFV